MTDATFTFDPSSFLNGIKSIVSAMSGMEQRGKESSGKVEKAIHSNGKAISNVAGQLIKKVAGIAMAYMGLRAIMSRMPEIGRTWSIAGDIMMRNFLWPLRKELLPYLQKILDWTRDHRIMFVRWGNQLVNIFRIIKNIVSTLIDTLKRMWERLSEGLERIFGKSIKSMEDMVNIMIFKLSALCQFIMILLQPVFDFIIDSFVTIIQWVKAFADGFVEGMGDITPALTDVYEQFVKLLGVITGVTSNNNVLINSFKTLGAVLGMTVRPILAGIGQMLDTLVTSIETVVNRVAYFKAWKDNNKSEMNRLDKEMDGLDAGSTQRMKDRWGGVWDNTKAGVNSIKNTWTGNGLSNVETNSNSSTNNTTVNVDVKVDAKSADSKTVGKDTANEVVKKLKDSKALGRRNL